MTGGGSRKILFLKLLLVLLALPGLLILMRDLLRPGEETVVARAERWHPLVAAAAERFDVEPELIIAVIAVESKGDRGARSDRGAMGLMQLMPATAREEAGRIGLDPPDAGDLLDPEKNILLGTSYLGRQLRSFDGDVALALAAYNAGPGRVRGWLRSRPGATTEEILGEAAFPMTRIYVSNVLGYRELIAGRYPERNE